MQAIAATSYLAVARPILILACCPFSAFSQGEETTSLDAYIERMKPGQKDMYYLAGNSRDELEASPLVEALLKKGARRLILLRRDSLLDSIDAVNACTLL